MNLTDDAGVAALDEFEIEAAHHRRMLTFLFTAFALFYFGLLVSAAYFPSLCAIRLAGRINVGMLFVISQYLFGCLIAWIYVARMRTTDNVMSSITL